MYRINTPIRPSRPKRKEYEHKVQGGLAVTPSQMQKLAEQGIPVAAQNLGLGFQDGVSELDYQPPLEHMRGVDIADLWEARQQVKDKVRKAKSKLASAEALKTE